MPMTEDLPFEIVQLSSPVDLISAYRFVYEQYVKSGYIESNPLKLRIREDFELRYDTTTFGAISNDMIVATISVIGDGIHGIPIDRCYPDVVDVWRRKGKVCEVSNLVISPNFRRNRRLLHSLMRNAMQICVERELNTIFIAVSPRHTPYFSRLFGCVSVGDQQIYGESDIIQGMMAQVTSPEVMKLLDHSTDGPDDHGDGDDDRQTE